MPAQRGERMVLNAVGIQPGEVDVGDVVEPHDHPAVVPGVAAPLAGLLDPFGQHMPVDESLRGVDHSQTDVVDLRRVPLGCPPLPDLPPPAAQGLSVPVPVSSHHVPAPPPRGRPLALTGGGAVRAHSHAILHMKYCLVPLRSIGRRACPRRSRGVPGAGRGWGLPSGAGHKRGFDLGPGPSAGRSRVGRVPESLRSRHALDAPARQVNREITAPFRLPRREVKRRSGRPPLSARRCCPS